MKSWNKVTESRLSNIFRRLKRKRVELFVKELSIKPSDIVLDLGSEDGSYLSEYFPYPENIVIADIAEEPMRRGVAKNGLRGYRRIPTSGPLPFKDCEFDAVWCNSVIEHVTIDKSDLATVTNQEFDHAANEHQALFAQEIERISKKYFVQTPHIHFPIESHSWLPIIPYLTHSQRWKLGVSLKAYWIKQWSADFHLYSRSRFEQHFAGADSFYTERLVGIPKSLIAIRRE